MLRHTAGPMGLVTMALVELDDCVTFFFSDVMSRVAGIWISAPGLSYVFWGVFFHIYAVTIQSNFSGSNTFGTMKISSRQG